MVWVRIWKISPKSIKFFNFFPFGSKKLLWVRSESTRVKTGSAPYLLWVKSKLGSGQGPSLVYLSSGQPPLGLEIFPPKSQFIFFIFPYGPKKSQRVWPKIPGSKARPASYLLRVRNMLGLGQGPPLFYWS